MRFHYSLPVGRKLGLSLGKESCKIPKEGCIQECKKIIWNSALPPGICHEEMQWHCVSTWSAMGKRGSLSLLYASWPALGEVGSLACSPLTCTSKLSPNPHLLQNKTLRLSARNIVTWVQGQAGPTQRLQFRHHMLLAWYIVGQCTWPQKCLWILPSHSQGWLDAAAGRTSA